MEYLVTITDKSGDRRDMVVEADTGQLALQYVLEQTAKRSEFFFTDRHGRISSIQCKVEEYRHGNNSSNYIR